MNDEHNPIPCFDIVPTDEELESGDFVGTEVSGMYDGVLYWWNSKTNIAYPRKGFEKEFNEIFKRR